MKFCVVKITQGGGVAAPIAGEILGEVLPYLEIQKSNENEKQTIPVPDVKGMSLKDAQEILKDFEIQIISDGEYTKDSSIYKQIPESGIEISTSGKVILYVK